MAAVCEQGGWRGRGVGDCLEVLRGHRGYGHKLVFQMGPW